MENISTISGWKPSCFITFDPGGTEEREVCPRWACLFPLYYRVIIAALSNNLLPTKWISPKLDYWFDLLVIQNRQSYSNSGNHHSNYKFFFPYLFDFFEKKNRKKTILHWLIKKLQFIIEPKCDPYLVYIFVPLFDINAKNKLMTTKCFYSAALKDPVYLQLNQLNVIYSSRSCYKRPSTRFPATFECNTDFYCTTTLQ